MNIEARIESVLTGKPVVFGPKGQLSAMHKELQLGTLAVTSAGILGDEQADMVNHGGEDKAILHYAFDHYATWASEYMETAAQLGRGPGQFGENISTRGAVESDICIGDVFRLGSAMVQVSQGRQPCWKLNTHFGWNRMAANVQSTGRTGWYYRVLEPGNVKTGDIWSLQERLHDGFTLTRLQRALYVDMLNYHELELIADLSVLAFGWREIAIRRLEAKQVENWDSRLNG